MRKGRGLALAVLVLVVAGWASAAVAASDTTVEALKSRLRDMERRLSDLEDSKGDGDVKKMVDEYLAEQSGYDFRVYWDHGMRAKTRNGRIKMKFGGRLMNDWTWADGDSLEGELADAGIARDVEDGFEVRRARLYWEGEWNKRIKFKWQYDFAGDEPDVKDLYLELKKLPVVGNLRMGHFKEPFSLNELTSSKYITFAERALPNAFAPGRNAGFMLHNAFLEDRLTAAAGVFLHNGAFDDGDGEGRHDGDTTFTTRVTGLPMYADDGKRLVHLGGAYSHRDIDGMLRVRQRPEAHLLFRPVDTGAFGRVNNLNLFGGEAAVVWDSFHAEGEYIAAVTDASGRTPGAGEPTFDGWYMQAGYFITGEHRPYKKSSGAFTRVKPLKNYDEGGPGAWEIAFRYSRIDLNDDGITGGEMEDFTAGLNWYLNQNVRIMWNYIHSNIDDIGGVADLDDDLDIFLMRLQVDF